MPLSDNPAALSDIYDPVNNIAIWRRELDGEIKSSIDALFDEKKSLKIEGVATLESDNNGLLKPLDSVEAADALQKETNQLVDMFCFLFDLERVGVRLTTLEHAMCPRFHVDRVPCRLVTTFQGAAIEWLPNDCIDRTKLGTGNSGLPDDQSGIYQNTDDIHRMTSGDVALLKGEGWEGNENAGLVHRSPQLDNGEARLLLMLDFID